MITMICLAAVLLLVLLVLGMVQAVTLIVRLFTPRATQRDMPHGQASGTDEELRRLVDRRLITPEVYAQVALALDASRGNLPAAPAHFGSPPDIPLATPMAAEVAHRAPPPLPRVFSPPASRVASPPAPAERGSMFASFLERRNIRWGELLGGLLILGCSTALVVSFWAEIADRPIFKFALFTLATAAFFGVGLYSEHRWKLPTTSRAILLLATLLVPVNLLAFSALGGPRHAGDLSLAAQVASLAIFSLLVWPAARVLVRGSSVLLTVGLAGTCAALILVAAHPALPGALPMLAALPTGCLLICSAIMLGRLWRMRTVGFGEAMSAYLLLGAIGFTAWLAVGFLLFTAPHLSEATGALSPIFTALALPAFLVGLVIWKRADSQTDQRTGIGGVAVAIFGTAIMLIGLIAAWPEADRLAPMGALDALLLFATAIVFDLPAAYIPAALLAAMAWLVGFHTWPWWQHGIGDDVDRILNALTAADNGWLLLPMAAALGMGGMLAGRWRKSHAAMLDGLALAMSAASFGLANAPLIAEPRAILLDPACFDLLFGGGFLLLWLARRDAGRWWGALGTCGPLLVGEWVALEWDGSQTGELLRHLMPTLPIAICAAVPILGALIWWSGRGRVRPGIVAGLGLLETVGVLLLARWDGVGDYWRWVIPLFGHQTTAWAVLGVGVMLRRAFERSGAVVPGVGKVAGNHLESAVVDYRSASASSPRALAQSDAPIGLANETVAWTAFAGALACVALVAMSGYPRPDAAAALGLCILAATTACWADMPNGLFIAGALFNIACSFAMFIPPFNRVLHGRQIASANAVFLCVGGGLAWLLDRTVFAKRGKEHASIEGFHVVAGWLAMGAIVVLWGLHVGWLSFTIQRPDWVMWSALGAAEMLFAIRLLDREAVDPIAGIYFAGLLGTTFAIGCLPWKLAISPTAWGMALGLYALLSASVGMAGMKVAGGPEWRRRWMRRWLVVGSMILAACAVTGAIHGDFGGEGRSLAMLAAIVAMAQGIGLGVAAEKSQSVRQAAMGAVALGMVAMAWAIMPAASLERGFDAASAAIAAIAVFAIASAVCRAFVDETWRSAISPMLGVLLIAVAAGTVGIVVGEAADVVIGSMPMISRWSVIGIEAELLLGLAVAAALAWGWRGLAPKWRSACVWTAEGLAILAFAHLRITEPWLFSHRIEQYWPMIVMALAFGSISAGLALRRRGRAEIGKPMEHSGIGWPMVAILGYWLHPTIVDYSAVLWIAGVLYGIVAASRRSLPFTLIAAACINGGMWVVFSRHPESAFFTHPQLWIIPAALSVLGAVQIHHRRIGVEQMRGVRYICLAAIYLSSTADIVLNGVMVEPWLPMVLAGLAIAGVLAGIAWHIRPFLYLGMTFLLIAVLTMIWTAQQNLHWTWLWYVAGLAAGVALLAVFGLFEKRHERMTRLLEGLKQWQ